MILPALVILASLACSRDWKNPVDNKNSQPNPLPTEGLVAWYPLNGNANDESGNGLDGTVYGAVPCADRFNEENKAYYFNGTTYIEVLDNSKLDIIVNLSICTWYQYNGKASDWGRVISKAWNSANDPWIGYGILHDDKPAGNQTIGILAGLSNSTSATTGSPDIFKTGVWHHVCGVIDSDNKVISIYLDGKKQNDSTLTISTLANTSGNFRIGTDEKTLQGIVGAVDDVRVYCRVLRESEIMALYHEGGWDQ